MIDGSTIYKCEDNAQSFQRIARDSEKLKWPSWFPVGFSYLALQPPPYPYDTLLLDDKQGQSVTEVLLVNTSRSTTIAISTSV